ncbi:MAG TPA: hypothetical protein ENI07_15675 [Desulfobacterales bacterium]|nr:hypothetical protein [Desulfobacterales bacterium]
MIDLIRKIIELIRRLIGKESPKPAPKPDPKPKPKPPPLPPPPPADSPYFSFFGQQKFLVFVSYFDGIRAKYLESDLDYLKKGVDGIRLYLNFSYPPNRPWDFLFRPDGSLHPHKLGMLGHILRLAEERKMVVDISSSRRLDGVDGNPGGWQMPPGTYAHAWRLLALKLQEWPFSNYLIDIENESNCPWAGRRQTMTVPEAQIIKDVIRTSLPDVEITASVACNITPEAAATDMSFIGYHDPRVAGWAEDTWGLAVRCKRAIGDNSIKVYFQEPPRIGAGVSSTQELRVALAGARRAKIAGWCFHTDAGFTLSDGSFERKLKPAEREFLERK